jgi:hypothetical protein
MNGLMEVFTRGSLLTGIWKATGSTTGLMGEFILERGRSGV